MGRTADTTHYTQTELELWDRLAAEQDTVFYTAKGLAFRIRIKGNELFVDRREKSVTRASVNLAYRKWCADPECGPKALGVFGASYLWGVFRGIGSGEGTEAGNAPVERTDNRNAEGDSVQKGLNPNVYR